MKQTKQLFFYLSLLMACLLTGCDSVLGDDDITGNGDGSMQLAFTRSGESTSATSGFLIFWKQSFGDFFTAEVGDLNAYESTKFNTGEPYPKDNTLVNATGFSPAAMQHSSDFATLTLPDGTAPGTLDVCSASKIIQGSYRNPFSQTMTFGHTLTKVTFMAQRDVTMVDSKDVKNIQVTVPASYLPTRWIWNNAKYVADHSANAAAPLSFSLNETLVSTNLTKVGVAYLMLPAQNGGMLNDINIQADIIPIESTIVEKRIDQTVPAQLYEANNTTPVVNAEPGDAYEIIIKFQQNSFTLQARQSDWENGGLIYVPVKP